MSTREEQRAMILKKLWWMKKDQDAGKELALIPTLKNAIRKAMGIQPESITTEWGRSWQYVIYNRHYTEADEKKVDTVVERLVSQGYIKLHPHYNNGHVIYTEVEVLRTK